MTTVLVERLTSEDADWAAAVLWRRREALVRHAPVFWAPAAGRELTHAAYLRRLLSGGDTRGYRTDQSLLIATQNRSRWLVDDAAWWGNDGPLLWDAFAADYPGQAVRVVCPRYEPARLALVLSTGLHFCESWWLRELPDSGGGEAGSSVSLAGAVATTVAAPPVYAPPGPILLVAQYTDLARTAPAAATWAEQLGCAAVVFSVGNGSEDAADILRRAGFRPHCDFLEGDAAPTPA